MGDRRKPTTEDPLVAGAYIPFDFRRTRARAPAQMQAIDLSE
jgi:hypothetical protein